LNNCFFVSDLHGIVNKYSKLFSQIEKEEPNIVFIGGDLLPSGLFHYTRDQSPIDDFIQEYLAKSFAELKNKMGDNYPSVYLILGNDDARIEEESLIEPEKNGIWKYINQLHVSYDEYDIFGYSFVPPTPFRLKDWEKYDVSRFTDPGCISPEEGLRTIDISDHDKRYSTIQIDLEKFIEKCDIGNAVILFHSPPYQTALDRAALDGKMIDHTPLDVHIGSIAIKRFIEKYQPILTMHGHVHESTELTGKWIDQIGKTYCFNAAHNGEELSIIQFSIEQPEHAKRILI